MIEVVKNYNLGLTPKEIVEKLDKHIVGQLEAKKAVAIALRNRYRRRYVSPAIKNEIVPKNILMIGPTGVGKTEIARRLSKLAGAPFIKVEATKFTEVGYVGRDVESIIRDLVEIAVNTQKTKAKVDVINKAKERAIERVLDVLVGKSATEETRNRFYEKIINNELDDKQIEINVADTTPMASGNFDIPGMPGAAMGVLNISDMIGKTLGVTKQKLRKLTVKEAIEVIISEESEILIDHDKIIAQALEIVESDGIVFLDEIDKISSRGDQNKSGQVSREGVQRDLLPLIEGTNVTTKYGNVKTDYILFIASGAFHLSKPSDLLPELQGRLPIRVELNPLLEEDLLRILKEPEASIIKQYTELLSIEGIKLEFTEDAMQRLAYYGALFNKEVEDIGARRLHTIIEKLLQEISYSADSLENKHIIIDYKFVEDKLSELNINHDLSRFIL